MSTTKKTGRQHRKGAGRPKGSRKVLVKPELPLVANLGLATFGDLLGSAGAICGGILWDAGHPDHMIAALKKFGRENGLPERSPEEWAAHVEKRAQAMFSGCEAQALERAKAGDAQFFRDLGEMLERLKSGLIPDDRYRTALLWFADKRESPAVPLAVAELKELRDYLKKGGVAKSVRALQRDLGLMGLPFLRGKPGRRPGPRRAHKHKHKHQRVISLSKSLRDFNEAFAVFCSSRPEMGRKTAHRTLD